MSRRIGRVQWVQTVPAQSFASAAAAISDTTIYVVDGQAFAVDATPGSVLLADGTVVDYDSWTDDSITLSAPLAVAVNDGDPVQVYPAREVKWAGVNFGPDDDWPDVVSCTVPYEAKFFTKLADDTYDIGDQPQVEVEMEPQPHVVDLLNQPAAFDGSYIDPTTTIPPGALTDGIAPTDAPTSVSTVTGINSIFVHWDAITNPDPVQYELHVSTTSGFTPDSSTLLTTIAGTMVVAKTLADLTPLAYGTTYYFKVIAVDADGSGPASSEASGTTAQVATVDLAALAVTATQIAASAVTTAKIAADAVTSAEIAANAVGNTELAAGAVTASKITANTITAAQIAAGTITANEIAALTITASQIAAATITGTKIAANTITAGNIAADTITASEIAANAITASEIAANAVTAGKLEATLVLASAIVTATSGQRVEITTNGIRAYNSSGTLVTEISSSTGLLTAVGGSFASASSGERIVFSGSGLDAYTDDAIPIRTIPAGFSGIAADGTRIIVVSGSSVSTYTVSPDGVLTLGTLLSGAFKSSVCSDGTYIYAIDISTEDIRKFNISTGVENLSGFPIAGTFNQVDVSGGNLYAIDNANDIRKYSASTGTQNLSGFPIVGTFNYLTVAGGNIYTTDSANDIYKYDATTGVQNTSGFPIVGTYTIVDSDGTYLYVVDTATSIGKFNASTGAAVSNAGFPLTGTAFYGLASDTSFLYAIDTAGSSYLSGDLRIFNASANYNSIHLDATSGTLSSKVVTTSDVRATGDGSFGGKFTIQGYPITGAWTSFTPTWLGSVTNPTIGNGSIVGKYMRLGNTMFLRIIITLGSTTTVGSGNYTIGNLPFDPIMTFQPFTGWFFDTSASALYPLAPARSAASTLTLYRWNTTAGGGVLFTSATAPVVPANGDQIIISGSYEVA